MAAVEEDRRTGVHYPQCAQRSPGLRHDCFQYPLGSLSLTKGRSSIAHTVEIRLDNTLFKSILVIYILFSLERNVYMSYASLDVVALSVECTFPVLVTPQ